MNKVLWAILLLLLVCTGGIAAEGWNFTPLPLVFYTSDTGIAGGALLVAERSVPVYEGEVQDDKRAAPPKGKEDTADGAGGGVLGDVLWQIAATYTQERQTEISSLFQSDFMNGAYRLTANAGFFNTPSVFYGVGPDSDLEESYEEQKLDFEFSCVRRLWKQLYAGPLYLYTNVEYTDFESDGAIAQYVHGSNNTGISSELGLVLQWDSRSSLVYPRNGSYVELRALHSGTGLGSDFDFSTVKLDARGYYEIIPDTVLALQAIMQSSSGSVPLHKMEELGGVRVLRGYQFGRYRDESSAVVQGEVRFPIFNRLGGVVFGAAGQVEEGYSRFSLENTKAAGGLGFRFQPNKKSDVRIRVDLGFSRDFTGIYITLLEAF